MSTDKEGTLQIKDFRGISRFKSSPNTDPNLLYTMQNVYSPRRGEIAPVPGYEIPLLTQAFVTGFTDIQYLFNFKERALALSTQSGLSAPTIGNFSFTTSGSGSTATTVKLSFSGLGGESPLSGSTTANWGSTGITVLATVALPDGCCAVNMYTLSAGVYCWVASFTPAIFGTSQTILPRVMEGETTVRPKDPADLTTPTPTFTPIAGGTLTPGTKLFFAFAPWIRNTAASADSSGPIVTQRDDNQNYIVYTIPDGFSGVNVKPALTGFYDGVNTYTNSIVFAGTNAECLLAVGHNTSAYATPFPVATLNATGINILSLPKETNLGFTIVPDTTGRVGYFYPFHQSTPSLVYPVGALAMGVSVDQVTGNIISGGTQILPVRGETLRAFAGDVTGSLFVPVNNPDSQMAYTILGELMFFVNGYQEPFYTDGRIIQPLIADYQSARAPICPCVTTFKGRLIMAGGTSNLRNTSGLVYYSELFSDGQGNPFDWSKTHSATPAINFQQARPANGSSIVGFGINSYNQSTGSLAALLVVGLTAAIFISEDIAAGIQETESNIGFASNFSFVNSNVGAFFLGTDNFYQLGRDGRPTPVGNDVASILADRNVATIPHCLFSNGIVKIDYADSTNAPQCLWLDVQLEPTQQGMAPRMTWYGPHTVVGDAAREVFQTSNPSYPQARYSAGASAVYRLDVFGIFEAGGDPFSRILVFNDLTLSTDHFIKLLKRIYISAKIKRSFNIAMTVTMTDNFSQEPESVNELLTLTYPADTPVGTFSYQLFQKEFLARYRGRVIKDLTLSFAVNEDFSIYDISLLFQPTRRRLMPA